MAETPLPLALLYALGDAVLAALTLVVVGLPVLAVGAAYWFLWR